MNLSIKNLAITSMFLMLGGACLAQSMGPTPAQVQQIRQSMVKTNADACLHFEGIKKSDLSRNTNKLSAYCQCTAETYVNSIGDEKLFEMMQHPLADKAEQAAVKTKFDAIKQQCHKAVGM